MRITDHRMYLIMPRFGTLIRKNYDGHAGTCQNLKHELTDTDKTYATLTESEIFELKFKQDNSEL